MHPIKWLLFQKCFIQINGKVAHLITNCHTSYFVHVNSRKGAKGRPDIMSMVIWVPSPGRWTFTHPGNYQGWYACLSVQPGKKVIARGVGATAGERNLGRVKIPWTKEFALLLSPSCFTPASLHMLVLWPALACHVALEATWPMAIQTHPTHNELQAGTHAKLARCWIGLYKYGAEALGSGFDLSPDEDKMGLFPW